MIGGGSDQYRFVLSQLAHDYPLFNLALNCHRNTRGQPLSFADKPYLVEMYTELPKLDGADIRKAVQTGLSELFIQLMFERSGWAGRISAYVLPTFTIRDRFVQNRINPLLAEVPEYRSKIGYGHSGGVGNLKLKRFGKGAMLFLGSNTLADFIEFSADTLIVDEFDQCDPINLAKARDRLRASPDPQLFRLGNPTLPRVGISRLFDKSDGRRWFSRCSRCSAWQPLDWFESVVMRGDDGKWMARDIERARGGGDLRPICTHCSKPFDRSAKTGGWVSERPSAVRRGYWVSRLDVLSESYRELFDEWVDAQGRQEAVSTFYTSVLGVPFEFSGARLTMEMLADSATGDDLDYGGGAEYDDLVVTMGVDVGSLLHCTISVASEDDEGNLVREMRFVGTMRTFAEVSDLIRRYRVDSCVIDAMPETRKAQELRDEFLGESCSVWLCRFHKTDRVGAQSYGLKLNHRDRVVNVDRTQVFDATFDDIREGRRMFPVDVQTVLGWTAQMRAPVRVLNEAKGRIIWTEGGAADHFRLSDIYDRIAYDVGEMGGSYYAG